MASAEMAIHHIRRGLSLPIAGEPAPTLDRAPAGREAALLGADFVGLRPTMRVQVGDPVRRGSLLFQDKRIPGLRFTSPTAGRVLAIHRGAKRAFLSIVLELSEAERSGRGDTIEHESFASFRGADPRALDREAIVALLLESGEWTALRQRPFSRVPDPATRPDSIFVTAMDTHPLAPPIPPMLEGRAGDLERGLHVLVALADGGPVFVCTDPRTEIPAPTHDRIRIERFEGPHPAGTVGVHIHHLDPVDREHVAWHLGLQDLLAIGALFADGRLHVDRIVALGGPAVIQPRLLLTRRGASLHTLTAGELAEGEVRLVSGSVLAGRRAMGEAEGFLGRYHQQVSAIREERERDFLGWLSPGSRKYSALPTFLSRLFRGRRFALGSSTGGSPRAIVPIGVYEKVLPMDLEPTYLLKAIMMQDPEWAERLGCLELDEEDLALCAFVCPGKSDFGGHLRQVLTVLEEEGA